jgi:hypothetical protein
MRRPSPSVPSADRAQAARTGTDPRISPPEARLTRSTGSRNCGIRSDADAQIRARVPAIAGLEKRSTGPARYPGRSIPGTGASVGVASSSR